MDSEILKKKKKRYREIIKENTKNITTKYQKKGERERKKQSPYSHKGKKKRKKSKIKRK